MPEHSSWVDEEERIARTILPGFTDDLWKKISSGKSSENDKVAISLIDAIDSNASSFKKNRFFLSIARRVDKKDYDGFVNIIEDCKFDLKQIKNITGQLNLPCVNSVFPPCLEAHRYTQSQLQSLQEYVQSPDTDFTGAVAVYQPHAEPVCYASDTAHADKYYNIASVGKIFTGILPLKLVHDRLIPESKLTDVGVTVPEAVISQFPSEHRDEVRQRLSEVSLHQLMAHTAGFGDYGPEYVKEMEAYTERNVPPPVYSDHNELLKFSFENANNGLTAIGEPRYSNVGMVLLAAATQELYNQAKKTNIRARSS